MCCTLSVPILQNLQDGQCVCWFYSQGSHTFTTALLTTVDAQPLSQSPKLFSVTPSTMARIELENSEIVFRYRNGKEILCPPVRPNWHWIPPVFLLKGKLGTFPAAVKLTIHLHPVLRGTMSGVLPPLPSVIVVSTGKTLVFLVYYLSTLSIAKII